MRLFFFLLLFFCDGLLAVVYQQSDKVNTASPFPVVQAEIPVSKKNDAELGLLQQLKLKIQGAEENSRHLWNKVRPCEGCHAFNKYAGNSYLPILQGQNQQYLFSKLLMFKSDRRSRHPLSRYLELLSVADLMDISHFYAEQRSDLKRTLVLATVKRVDKYDMTDRRQSALIRDCMECHGIEGNGGRLIPAISGQNRGYLSYRIREIADDRSIVHPGSDVPVSCKIKNVTVRQSRQLANLLAIVVDDSRVEHGAAVYKAKCAECHDDVSQELHADWSEKMSQGTRLLVKDVLTGVQHKVVGGRFLSFSRIEVEDAIHYMIDQLQHSL